MDGPDSLDDWVAIKENPFSSQDSRSRLVFHVAWNSMTSQIAVTCRCQSRKVSDKDSGGYSGLFSIDDIRAIHNELSLIHHQLEMYHPNLPKQHYNIMSFFANVEIDSEYVVAEVTNWLKIITEICGEKLVVSTLFDNPNDEEYFESLNELRKKRFDDEITNLEDELNNVIFLRNSSISMLDISTVYEAEDDCLNRLFITLSLLYNYQLQPFLDMREVAYHKMREARQKLNDPNFGERVTKEFAGQFSEWQNNYTRALDMIEDTYVAYYTRTSAILQDAHARMVADQRNFGKMAFQIGGQDRLDRIAEELSLEKQQLLKTKKRLMENQRDKIKYEIASLDESPNTKKQAEKLEKKCYDKQLEIFAIQLDIHDEEDNLLKMKIEKIHRATREKENDVVFYDAVEDMDEMEEEDVEESKVNPELAKLSEQRVNVNRKRAAVRNKKRALQAKHRESKLKKEEDLKTQIQHHSVQIKRDKEAEEKKAKQQMYDEERRKTLCRLKEYRMKYKPTRSTIRRPRTKADCPPSLQASPPKSLSTSAAIPPPPPQNDVTPPPPAWTPPPPPPPPAAIPPPPPPPPAFIPPPPPPPPPGCPVVQVRLPCPLKPVPAPRSPQKPQTPSKEDSVTSMMDMIRRGVKLKPVPVQDKEVAPPSEDHAQYLHHVLKRIGQSTATLSDDEEVSEGEFD